MVGLLLLESLADASVLALLNITKIESWKVKNAAEYQPSEWTAYYFTADDDQGDIIAQTLSQALKPQGWYINASTDMHVYVIFPDKIFKYPKGDHDQRKAVKRHGRSMGIPESQLDWNE